MRRLRRHVLTALAVAVVCLGSQSAQADPVVMLHSSNAGVTAMTYSFDPTTNTITINSTYGSTGAGSYQFSGLTPGVSYTVINNITNASGLSFNSLANELLDPLDSFNDNLDPQPYPGFVPPGFSTSNDNDGLSFAQGSGLPRTSSAFASVISDELTDVRDFLDFINGTAPSDSTFFVRFGLRDNFGDNQPFLLLQRPNTTSAPAAVPEPATLALLSLGLAGVGTVARRRRAARRGKD